MGFKVDSSEDLFFQEGLSFVSLSGNRIFRKDILQIYSYIQYKPVKSLPHLSSRASKNHFLSICCSTNSWPPAFSYMTRPPFHLLDRAMMSQRHATVRSAVRLPQRVLGMRGPFGRARSIGDPFLNAKIPTLPLPPMNVSDLNQ